MRSNLIIATLQESEKPIPLSKFAKSFQVSERTIQSDLQYLVTVGKHNGFKLETIRNEGYILVVNNQQQLNNFLVAHEPFEIVNTSPEQRQFKLIFFLLNERDFLPSHQIIEKFQVSHSTIRKDLTKISDVLKSYKLSLVNKPYYGTKVIGSEYDKRTMLVELLYQEKSQLKEEQLFKDVSKAVKSYQIYHLIIEKSQQFLKQFNEESLEKLALYLGLVLSRQTVQKKVEINDQSLHGLADQLLCDLSRLTNQSIALGETGYLIKKMVEVGYFEVSEISQEQQITEEIQHSLLKVDDKFSTDFSTDQTLLDSLKKHILPLIERVKNNRQLDNPMIQDVYARYADAFSVSLYFLESFNKESAQSIRDDEVAYLSLYFAGSIEKQKHKVMASYQKVLIVCTSGGGAAYLLKMKLEAIFVGATIETTSILNLSKIQDDTYDLILSTTSLDTSQMRVPVMELNNYLDETEQQELKNFINSRPINHEFQSMTQFNLYDLFKEECFIRSSATDYLELLKARAQRLTDLKYADTNYPEMVLKRELSMTTIYGEGVAGPHAIEMGAIRECIDVIILEQGITYQGKKVKVIFLINLNKGHLNLHKQISRLMLKIMADATILKSIEEAQDYKAFIKQIKRIV